MSDNTYEKLTQVLGKPKGMSGEHIVRLINDLQEQPIVDSEEDEIWYYYFKEHGVEFSFDTRAGMFESFLLHIATTAIPAGMFKQYTGNLPLDIAHTDSKDEVEQKLPGATSAIKNYLEDADLRPFELYFKFDNTGKQLLFVSVSYLAP